MLPSHGRGALREPTERGEPGTAGGPKGSLVGLEPTPFRPARPHASRIAYPRPSPRMPQHPGQLVSVRWREAFEAELQTVPERMEPMAKTSYLGLGRLRPISG